MSAQEPHLFEESLRQIEQTLEQKPDRDVVEKWLSNVMLKLGEIHEDVRELERDLAYVTSQVDDL
jgi:lipoate synthase